MSPKHRARVFRGTPHPADAPDPVNPESRRTGERGVTLILTTMLLTVIMGMAAFAVDLGWLYLRQTQAQKAAESAALAGVVHMPLPSATPFTGSEAETIALAVATQNGYTGGAGITITPLEVVGEPNQIRVDIKSVERTWFARVFGLNRVTVGVTATAEQIPPLKLGSDEPYLGEDPTIPGRDRDFFVAISGQDRVKGNGDAFAAEFRNSGGSNPEYEVPSYWYGFELPDASGAIGRTLGVQIFDPVAHDESPDGITNDWVNNNGRNNGDRGRTIFRVYAPDATPGDWKDNSTLLCEETFYTKGHALYDASAEDVWYTTCNIPNAQKGYYVVEVSTRGRNDMINGWSLRGTIDGVPATSGADLQVYGLGTMSLWQFETGSNPVFKIAKLEPYYAGQQLIISLWDISDIGSGGTLQFTGSVDNIDCQVRQLDDRGNIDWNWTSDDGQPNCYLTFSSGAYNNKWLEFRFDVPPNYTCVTCWVNVSYGVSGGITDRTTWSAKMNGQPIHLVY